MNKDRIAGTAKGIMGSVKVRVSDVLNDARLLAEGRAQKVEGKIQNAVGVLKDAMRE